MLSVDELELVELHVLSRLLQIRFSLHDLILQLLNKLGVLGATRTPIVHLLKLDKLLVQVSVLLIHKSASVAKLTLEGLNLRYLLTD